MDMEMTMGMGMAGEGNRFSNSEFIFSVISTQTISGVFRTTAGETITVLWGDGTSNTYTGITDQAYTKNYGSVGSRTVVILNSKSITRFTSTQDSSNIGFNLNVLPKSVTYFRCTGANTVSGNLSSIPTVMTYFYCYGANTITGNLSSLPVVMTSFTCYGSNTIIGNLSSLPAVMTSFTCYGSNTISGNLSSIPAVMTYFNCAGSNTIADYITRTWANNMDRVCLVQAATYGLSSAEVDQLLIDLATRTWTATKTITLVAPNAARTAASDAAVATLNGLGVTVKTA
jgi:hypothetical protein